MKHIFWMINWSAWLIGWIFDSIISDKGQEIDVRLNSRFNTIQCGLKSYCNTCTFVLTMFYLKQNQYFQFCFQMREKSDILLRRSLIEIAVLYNSNSADLISVGIAINVRIRKGNVISCDALLQKLRAHIYCAYQRVCLNEGRHSS